MAWQLIAENEAQLASHIQELKNFERLPSSDVGKLTPTGKAHEPSVLPELCKDNVKKGALKYPVFYYKRDGLEQSDSNGDTKK